MVMVTGMKARVQAEGDALRALLVVRESLLIHYLD